MSRLRIETVPEITVLDEPAIFKSLSNSSVTLVEFKDHSGNVVGSIQSNGRMNVSSISVSNPGTESTDFVTKAYVDAMAEGISWHEVVNYATTEPLPSCTYNNGVNGVGATLTANQNGRLVVDGANVVTGQSILVKNQVNAAQNGIYKVTEQGADSTTAFVLTRRQDADNSIAGSVKPGDALLVLSGSSNSTQGFILISMGSGTNGVFVLGTDDLNYTQFVVRYCQWPAMALFCLETS
jgi:hypothetical protein